jgi:Cyclic nucleotide-binding domain
VKIERAVTTISWIPSEAFTGVSWLTEQLGLAHYDQPPPDDIGDRDSRKLDRLRQADRFRFANRLRAWVDVDADGAITDFGHSGLGTIGSTTLNLGVGTVTVRAVPLPDLRPEPEVGQGWVRFTQTAGGRTGVPAPRPTRKPPFVQYFAPIAWTTLELTIWADGRHEGKLVGASVFPRHWVYGDEGRLEAKSGLTDLKNWLGSAFGDRTPWGATDSPALVTAVETELERQLSTEVMQGGAKPEVLRLGADRILVQQGEPGDALFVLLDGVVAIEVDGNAVAEIGPGAVLGERAVLEGGVRTSTIRTVTPCRVAVARADQIDLERLAQLAEGHRREDA